MIRNLKPKDKTNFISYCLNQRNKDFYITLNNKRLYLNNLKISKMVFNNVIKRGDICYIDEVVGKIRGILLIVGFSDRVERKYLKIVANNNKLFDGLLRVFSWNYKKEVFLKIKKDNYLCRLTKKYGFCFQGLRGTEILYRKGLK